MALRPRSTIPAATSASVDEFERHCGFTLPAELRQFLVTVNGARVVPEVPLRLAFSGQAISLLSALFGLGGASYASLEANFDNTRDDLPVACLPIGCDPGGNLLLLSCAGSHVGKIFFATLEGLSEMSRCDLDELACVAQSYAELLKLAEGGEHAV